MSASKSRDLAPFFAPRSIAVIGAGERPTSSGGAVMQMLRLAGYGGRVVPVNPRGGEIFGYPAVTTIAEIEPPVELAVIVIRPDAILDAAREAADRGVRNLLILPGGFAEAGPAGVARNEALLKLAAERGLTVAGPNCAGIIHLDPAWRFAATFLRDLPPGGRTAGSDQGAGSGLAFISQSGALAEEFIDKAKARALPLLSVVSVGNAVHLGVEDYLAWLGEQPEIGAALLYVESIEDHRRFREVARRVAAAKPVIALFGGRTEKGARAAFAHTGAVANDDAAIDAFAASCGIVQVTSLRALLLAAKAFGRFPQGLGKRALILSNSGGPGVICADRASLEGLDLAPLPTSMAKVLRQQLPPEASVANPIDLLADAREERFGFALEATLEHAWRAYDAVLMIHVVPFMVEAGPVIDRLAALAAGARLPMLHCMMGTLTGKREWFATMERAGVPVFNDAEEMAEAAGLLARYPVLRAAAQSDNFPMGYFRDRRSV